MIVSLLYKFTRFFIYFLFLSDEGPTLKTLDFTIRIGSTPTFLYFDLKPFSTLPMQHTMFILQILPFYWLSYSQSTCMSIGDQPLVAKGINFQMQNNGRKLMFCRGFSFDRLVGLY